ncbi:hypothetical protein H4R34_004955 [Dimargaris verticillata]|uniref:Major facilitator superfamily domain-containing protein n=1 Tax=Dimargaris verticillata TaxID=2761393 RepID=A0A9W8AZ52_9FUNG|nr:hypothetical protein H4R34_004955 [Dimargaris verticillata]
MAGSSARTVAYAAACVSMLGAGTVYLFSLYGPSFKRDLHFTGLQTNVVASAGDYGLYLSGPLWGYLVDCRGPRLLAAIGTLFLLAGYMSLALLFHLNWYASTTAWAVPMAAVGFGLVGLGSQSAYMASMSTTARSFTSTQRGLALGLPIGLFGLSAFFFSQVNRWLFMSGESTARVEPHFQPERFLLFMAIATSAAHFAATCGLKVVAPSENRIQTSSSPSDQAASSAQVHDQPSEISPLLAGSTVTPLVTSADSTRLEEDHKDIAMAKDETAGGNPPSKLAFFHDPQCLLLFLGIFGIAGTGLMFINNGGTVVETLLSSNPKRALQLRTHVVSLFSVCSFAARVVLGHVSDRLLRWQRMPRVALLAMAGLVMTVAQIAMAHITSTYWLPTLTMAMGWAYGAIFTLGPTVTSEYWGTHQLGYHWGWMSLGPALGGHLCNSIFGLVYDAHTAQPTQPHSLATTAGAPMGGYLQATLGWFSTTATPAECIGPTCFHQAFITTAAIAAFSTLMFICLLVYRLRQLHRHYYL